MDNKPPLSKEQYTLLAKVGLYVRYDMDYKAVVSQPPYTTFNFCGDKCSMWLIDSPFLLMDMAIYRFDKWTPDVYSFAGLVGGKTEMIVGSVIKKSGISINIVDNSSEIDSFREAILTRQLDDLLRNNPFALDSETMNR